MQRSLPASRILALTLILPLASTGCTDSTTAPVQAQEVPRATEQEKLLLAVLDRLDAIEARLDQQTATLNARLDSMSESVRLTASLPQAPGQPGQPATGGNGLSGQLDGVDARTDSIMALVDFLAKGSASPWQGFTVCGGLGLKGVGDLKSRTQADAEGEGGVGVKPWDTGALAKIAVRQRLALEFGAGAELALGVSGCVDLSKFGTTLPATRSTVTHFALGAPAAPGAEQLQATLMGLKDQLGLDESRVSNAVSQATSIFQSGDLSRLTDLSSTLPVPPVFQDPIGTITNRISTIDPVGLLCSGGNFGPRVGPYVSQGCQLIQSGSLPDIGSYPLFATNLSNLQDRFGSLCSRFNSVIDRRLTVTTNLPWGGSNSLDVALFPTTWKVACG